MKICFATNNKHKLREIREIIGNHVEILSLADIGCHEEIPEKKDSIEGNSHQKADYVFKNYNVNCFADDTGLEVEALKGAPGVKSARYAGNSANDNENVELLLNNLSGKPNRNARFKTVITLILAGKMYQFEGIAKGRIAKEPKGTNGFGYDPVFIPDGYKKTFAEMSSEEKNKISHRRKATAQLVNFIKSV